MNKKIDPLSLVLPFVLVAPVFILFFGLFVILRSASIEELCISEAKKTVGERWCDLKASDNKNSPDYIEGKPAGMCRGYYEQLKCEGKQKVFLLF